MKRVFVIAVTLLATAALLIGCSSDKKSDTTPAPALTAVAGSSGATQTTPNTTAAPGKWDKSTIYNYGVGANNDLWQQACGKPPIAVQEGDACIADVMKLGKASDSAIAFFQTEHYFLVTFEEHGRVDYGQAGAPWFNMGRPTPILFLNGSPDIIEAAISDDYKTDPSYAALLKPAATATPGNAFTPAPDFPWGEYGQLTAATSSSSSQQFIVSYPMRGCRACADDGYLPIAYNFDTQGKLTGTKTMPFKPK